MNALSKILTGSVVVMAVLSVACGKKNSGDSGGSNPGVGCIQNGATCIAPGQPGFGGKFQGSIGNGQVGYSVTINIRSSGGGYGGGYGGGWGQPVGYQTAVQSYIDMTLRQDTRVTNVGWGGGWGQRTISGRGLFNIGGTSTITANDGGIYLVNVQFNQAQMNIQIAGAINAAGTINQISNGGWGNNNGGYGNGYYGDSGWGNAGWQEEVIVNPVSPTGWFGW